MLERVNAFLWGPFMLTILAGVGLYFTVGTGVLQLRHFGKIFTKTLGTLFTRKKTGTGGAESPSVSPFAAMSTALASCLGTGNIAGVASALVMGGPGALFWMWASAFLCMATKYAEVTLAIRFRKRTLEGVWRGGPMYYIELGLGNRWKWLAVLFAGVCLLSTLGTGNLTQVGAMTGALADAYGIPPLWVGAAAMVIVGLTIFGGIQGVSKVAERLVPFISLLYILGATMVLVVNSQAILPALETIVQSAFGLKPVAGGVLGYTVAQSMRYGVARGVFSNEAGMGSSPIAHAAADTKSPAAQGLWGALEVFLDTMVMCTLTGVVILVSGAYNPVSGMPNVHLDGAALTGAAFSTVFGAAGPGFVAISISLFAITSVMGWSCYGEACCIYLFGSKRLPLMLYRLCYLAVIPVGAVMSMDNIWAVADLLNSAMMIPNLAAILFLSGQVFALTRETFGGYNKRGGKKRKFMYTTK